MNLNRISNFKKSLSIIQHIITRKIDDIKYKNIPQVPQVTKNAIKMMEDEIKAVCGETKVRYIEITPDKYRDFEKMLGFEHIYHKRLWNRYERKISEYYLAAHLLNIQEGKGIYIDVASQNSPWAEWCNLHSEYQAYALDIEHPRNVGAKHFICADATHMPFKDNSIDAMSLQSALETFFGNDDINFIKECGRVLRGGGKVVIAPLYLNTSYCNLYGKSYFEDAVEEEEASKYLRLDFDMPFTRLYDVKNLKNRLLDAASEVGLDYSIYVVDSKQTLYDKKDTFIYLHFALLLEKKGTVQK